MTSAIASSARSTSSKKSTPKSIAGDFIDTESMESSLNLNATYRRLGSTTQAPGRAGKASLSINTHNRERRESGFSKIPL
jgi:hypothetical protein